MRLSAHLPFLVCLSMLVTHAVSAQGAEAALLTVPGDPLLERPRSEEQPESTGGELCQSCAGRSTNEESPTSSSDVHLHIGTLVGTRVGMFGRTAEEMGGLMGARFGRLQVKEELVWGSSSVSRTKSGASVGIRSLSTQALGCYSVLVQTLDLYPCAGFDWTRVKGRPAGLENARHVSASWLSFAVGAALSWTLRHAWQLELTGIALLPIKRPRAFPTDVGNEGVPRTAALGSRINLGLQWEFF